MNPVLKKQIVELIDRLERHKSAAAGETELKIGWRTVVDDYDACLNVLLDIIKPTHKPTKP